jgi:hypothetical protein
MLALFHHKYDTPTSSQAKKEAALIERKGNREK